MFSLIFSQFEEPFFLSFFLFRTFSSTVSFKVVSKLELFCDWKFTIVCLIFVHILQLLRMLVTVKKIDIWFCWEMWHAEPRRWLWACNTKKDTDRLVEVQGAFRPAYRKRDECEVKRNYLYNMHKTCNVVWQWDMVMSVWGACWQLMMLLKWCDETGWGGLVMLRGEMSCVG